MRRTEGNEGKADSAYRIRSARLQFQSFIRPGRIRDEDHLSRRQISHSRSPRGPHRDSTWRESIREERGEIIYSEHGIRNACLRLTRVCAVPTRRDLNFSARCNSQTSSRRNVRDGHTRLFLKRRIDRT